MKFKSLQLVIPISNANEYCSKAAIINPTKNQKYILNKILHLEYMIANYTFTSIQWRPELRQSMYLELANYTIEYDRLYDDYINYNDLITGSNIYSVHI